MGSRGSVSMYNRLKGEAFHRDSTWVKAIKSDGSIMKIKKDDYGNWRSNKYEFTKSMFGKDGFMKIIDQGK